ncbi:MAG: hypothetical protein LBQ60_11355 [Bacteroidales bacterium]|jgi:predicted glycosyltransferase involved in capsule biosynthesis|nr:hypothetical protein [Bacteroidales bacterium]
MKYNLKDTTFLIITRLDTIERLENILAVTSFILKNFETNIHLWESSGYCNGFLRVLLDSHIQYSFIQDDDPIFHRTKYINRMMEEVATSYVSVWDTDVIAPPQQIIDTVNLLRNGKADFVYPYEKLFLETSLILRKIFLTNGCDLQVLIRNKKRMNLLYMPIPVGGAFFCNVDSYQRSGLENENFYGWGIEDGERYTRWIKKGFLVKRISGPLFHLTHPRGINSTMHHKDQHIIKRKILNLAANAQMTHL